MFRPSFLVLSLISISFLISSQEINSSFLKSLPEDLQQDFLAKYQDDNENNDKNYPNPDSRIDNLQQALETAERTLNNIKRDLENNDSFKNNKLRRIGDNFFQTFQSTFIPINVPNVDSTYVLDYGDQLTLQLIGQKSLVKKMQLQRDGTINIPDIGELNLAGLSLGEASTLLKNLVAQKFIGVEAFISLTELRDINVLIIGNVSKPGMYTLSGGSSPLSLLYAAGGIDENGSYRKIIHKRNNTELHSIDLYEVILKGNLSFSHQLRSGDVIVVSPKHSEVRVSGSFANPGIYEVLPSETFESLVDFIGIQESHTNSKFILERYSQNKVVESSYKLSDLLPIKLIDGDSISLMGSKPQFSKTKVVTIRGEVNAPGIYAIDDKTSVLDLIKKAGSYTELAYPLGGILIRESLKNLELESKEKGYNELIRFLVSGSNFSTILSSPDSSGIITFLSLLKDYEPVGRVPTEFSIAKLESNPILNRILEDGDHIYIPAFTPDVYVFGEVMNPGSVQYKEMFGPLQYVSAAGNFTSIADTSRILLISPTGQVDVVSGKLFNIFQNKQMVLPGSTVYVPTKIGKLNGVDLASTVAPIVSSVALSIASLNAINN